MAITKWVSLLKTKFVSDSIWSLAATVVAAVAGIGINTLIGKLYGLETLGLFSKSSALYLPLVTLSCWGSPVLGVRYAALVQQSAHAWVQIKALAVLSVVLGLVVTGLAYTFLVAYPLLPGYANGLFAGLLLSIPVTTLNRVGMAILNGRRMMKTYSVLQSLRWCLIPASIAALYWYSQSPWAIGVAFIISEGITLALIAMALGQYLQQIWQQPTPGIGGWWAQLKEQQVLAIPNIVNELNNNLDVLIMARFVTLESLGQYSLASMVLKGFLLVPNIIQTNFNPIISRMWEAGQRSELLAQIKRMGRYNAALMAFMLVAAIGALYVYLHLFFKGNAGHAFVLFLILSVGAYFISTVNFLGAFFAMIGENRKHRRLVFQNITIKAVLLLAFTGMWGIYGAALAISVFYIISWAIFLLFLKKQFS